MLSPTHGSGYAFYRVAIWHSRLSEYAGRQQAKHLDSQQDNNNNKHIGIRYDTENGCYCRKVWVVVFWLVVRFCETMLLGQFAELMATLLVECFASFNYTRLGGSKLLSIFFLKQNHTRSKFVLVPSTSDVWCVEPDHHNYY